LSYTTVVAVVAGLFLLINDGIAAEVDGTVDAVVAATCTGG
jgi:hypothetical protein